MIWSGYIILVIFVQTLAKNLQYLLDDEGDVQDTFMYNFRISYIDVFGTTINHELKENGEAIPVVNENKKVSADEAGYDQEHFNGGFLLFKRF